MNDEKMKNNDERELIQRLPELTKEEIAWAEKPEQKTWAIETLGLGAGYCWNMPDQGLSLQVYDGKTFRLLTVVDHDYCIMMVSYVRATLESVGITLDTTQVVKRPYTPHEEGQEHSHVSGVVSGIEVV